MKTHPINPSVRNPAAVRPGGGVTVIVEATLGSLWATPEALAEMSDEEIIDLCHEDVMALLDGAFWTVIRNA